MKRRINPIILCQSNSAKRQRVNESYVDNIPLLEAIPALEPQPTFNLSDLSSHQLSVVQYIKHFRANKYDFFVNFSQRKNLLH